MNEQQVRGEMQKSRKKDTTKENLHPVSDLLSYGRDYARERPEVVALWCFGIGFTLGWKLKMW